MTDTKTRVVFRKWRNGDVIALFPDWFDDNRGLVQSYEHVGQHGMADYIHIIKTTQQATQAEYADLETELTEIGYDLKITRRRVRHEIHS